MQHFKNNRRSKHSSLRASEESIPYIRHSALCASDERASLPQRKKSASQNRGKQTEKKRAPSAATDAARKATDTASTAVLYSNRRSLAGRNASSTARTAAFVRARNAQASSQKGPRQGTGKPNIEQSPRRRARSRTKQQWLRSAPSCALTPRKILPSYARAHRPAADALARLPTNGNYADEVEGNPIDGGK